MRSSTIEICSACITSCEVSTNVPCGGDSGHGGLTTITLKDISGTDMRITYTPKQGGQGQVDYVDVSEVTLWFGGDHEALNIIKLLRMASFHLEELVDQNERDDTFVRNIWNKE